VGKTTTLDPPTLAWARAAFGEYYRTAPVRPPDRIARREFAAFPFAGESLMRRHATLPTTADLGGFLSREAPRHVYYSSAYYRWPAEPTMAAKEWLGADLIFDLDSDHLRGAEALDYPAQLDLVKRRLTRLVDDFLLGDFGVDPAATEIVFSGGRGYHVHVREDRFLPMTSPERRELVDYVLGTGVEPMRSVRVVREGDAVETSDGAAVSEDAPGPARRPTRGTRSLVSPEAPGWAGRTTRAILEVLKRWEVAGRGDAEREMVGFGIPTAKARRWARLLVDDGGAEKIRRSLSLDVFPRDLPDELLEAIVRGASVEVQGETDAPVTTDIHRLIRLPGSLHGGTGFRVVPLARDAVDAFDPFRDALAAPIDGATTRVRFTADASYPFPGGGLRGRVGDADELPTPLALFLLLRQEAELLPSPT
jgi:DNA primase small subunit